MIVRRENYDGFKCFDFFNDGTDTAAWLYRVGREQEGALLIELTANAERNLMTVDAALMLVSGRRGNPHEWDHQLMEAAEVLAKAVATDRERIGKREACSKELFEGDKVLSFADGPIICAEHK
jgi:hypothetical protein